MQKIQDLKASIIPNLKVHIQKIPVERDIKCVMDNALVDRETAINLLFKHNGCIVGAIMEITM